MSGLDRQQAHRRMLHVPYRGEAPALSDLISGQVQLIFGNMIALIEHVRAGRLRALAMTSATLAGITEHPDRE